MSMDNKELIASRLKDIRKRLDLNQEELASKIGIKRNTLSQYESAKATMSMEVFLRFLDETNSSADWILSGNEQSLHFSSINHQKVESLIENLNEMALHDVSILIEAYLINHPRARNHEKLLQ